MREPVEICKPSTSAMIPDRWARDRAQPPMTRTENSYIDIFLPIKMMFYIPMKIFNFYLYCIQQYFWGSAVLFICTMRLLWFLISWKYYDFCLASPENYLAKRKVEQIEEAAIPEKKRLQKGLSIIDEEEKREEEGRKGEIEEEEEVTKEKNVPEIQINGVDAKIVETNPEAELLPDVDN